jgi:uncharacterized membrane protein YvlD (DUF360 family)
MVAFLCFFFPPVIAVVLTKTIRKENFGYSQYIAYYAVFAVIINGIMFWVLSFMFDPHRISAPDVFSTSFSAKYITLSSIFAVVSPYVIESIRKFKSMAKNLNQEDKTQKNTDKDD